MQQTLQTSLFADVPPEKLLIHDAKNNCTNCTNCYRSKQKYFDFKKRKFVFTNTYYCSLLPSKRNQFSFKRIKDVGNSCNFFNQVKL